MRIAYHMPTLHSIYAHRTIYNGFKNAFIDLGHDFQTFTSGDNLEEFLDRFNPHIFLTATHFFYKRQLDFQLLKKYRVKGMVMMTKVDFWNSPFDSSRVNEAKSLKDDRDTVSLIQNGLYGDCFYHVVEQGDARMEGFEKGTGYQYHTIPLAVDKIVLKGTFDEKFKADISYIGQLLPEKREFFKKNVFPLAKKYNIKYYGYDWSLLDRGIGWIQRVGQYFDIPGIRSLRKPVLSLEEEARVYKSSTISINVHESYQRKYGGECNERTFKIPFCNGFEVVDNVACIKKYFVPDKEIIIGNTDSDWREKVIYYLSNPEKREKIISAGKLKVEKYHTYHHRVNQIIKLTKDI